MTLLSAHFWPSSLHTLRAASLLASGQPHPSHVGIRDRAGDSSPVHTYLLNITTHLLGIVIVVRPKEFKVIIILILLLLILLLLTSCGPHCSAPILVQGLLHTRKTDRERQTWSQRNHSCNRWSTLLLQLVVPLEYACIGLGLRSVYHATKATKTLGSKGF